MALWRVLDYTKLNADVAEIIFDLGFDWRKERDSLRDIIPLRLLSLYSSYTSLIFIISLSLSLAKKHIYMMKGKTVIQPFPASGNFINCSEGIRSATFRLLLVLISFYFYTHFLSQCRYHAGVANNRFIGCLVGLLLLLYMASFASRLPTRSNPISSTSKQNEQANFCLFVLFGGSEGIRTPEPVKTTRFPIVPVMTTSIRFHITFLF